MTAHREASASRAATSVRRDPARRPSATISNTAPPRQSSPRQRRGESRSRGEPSRHQPPGSGCTGSGTNAGNARRQIDDRVRPLEIGRGGHAPLVARVIAEPSVAAAGHHGRQPRADEQRGQHHRPGAARRRVRRPARTPAGNRQRQQQRHEEPRRTARPGPPHRVGADRQHVGHRDDQPLEAEPARPREADEARPPGPAPSRAGRSPGRRAGRRRRSARKANELPTSPPYGAVGSSVP